MNKLFRGYDKEKNRVIDLNTITDIAYGCDGGIYNVKNWDDTVYIDTIEILQYSGLNDKNNKEIYEGDILEINDGLFGERHIVTVTFEKGCFGVYGGTINLYDLLTANKDKVKIIGNIFENKEYLEQKEEQKNEQGRTT